MPSNLGKTLTQPYGFYESRIIGYTYAPPPGYKLGQTEYRGPVRGYKPAKLDSSDVRQHMIGKLDKEFKDPHLWRYQPKPSVYYMNGHVTLQHKEPTNLGFTHPSIGWRWLFFGNLPDPEHTKALDHPNMTEAERIKFVQDLLRRFGTHGRSDGAKETEWNEQGFGRHNPKVSKQDEQLVEAWISRPTNKLFQPNSPRVHMHASRGHFYWVFGNDAMTKALNELVEGMVNRWPAAFDRRYGKGHQH